MSSSPPITIRVNTFVNNFSIDILSKIIVFLELAIGLNRFSILGIQKSIFVVLTFIYSVLLKCSFILLTYLIDKRVFINFLVFIKLVQYAFLCIFSQMTWKSLRSYYDELEKFDTEVGCRPKTSWRSIGIVAQLCVVIIYVTAILYTSPNISSGFILFPLEFTHVIENHYYGHLFNLLIPRIRLINFYLESFLSDDMILKSSNANEFTFYGNNCNNDARARSGMSRYMDLYHVIIRAHSLLIAAIKWQLLVIIITTFIFILSASYDVALSILNNNLNLESTTLIGISVAAMFPLFIPCICCDSVRAEVRRLRELLASILYENRLEKPCRSVSRALLSLTEARDMSFSLLRVVDISISLPFTFMGLLVTYLIIMLQFQKGTQQRRRSSGISY